MEPQKRKEIEEEISEVISEKIVNEDFAHPSVITNVSGDDGEMSGVYVSIMSSMSGITGEEIESLSEEGLRFVEFFGTTKKNPDMDESIRDVSVDEIPEASEVESELIFELSEEYLN